MSDWHERQERYPWLAPVPDKLPPRKPEPVPEFGWCARCKRMNPLAGDPVDRGSDWELGYDDCAYVAGVICPDCISPDERRALDVDALEALVHGCTAYTLFINPADAEEVGDE